MDRWVGKTAVVTGAGAGVGAGITAALATAGIRVIALEKRADLINDLNSQGNINIYPRLCDISKLDEVAITFKWIDETFNGIHILVNNAGVLRQGHITDVGSKTISEEDLLLSIDTIVKGTIICTRNAVGIMKRNNFDGHIFNINSIAGHYVPFASTLNVYPAAKNATVAFTQCLVNELSEFKNKIKVTSISPGMVNTNMAAHMLSLRLPMLQPSDIGDAILYVLSTPPSVNDLNSQGNINIYPRLCDISKLDEVAITFKWIDETFNGIHILVNNAGVLRQGHITDVGSKTISEEDLLLSIDTIVKGTIICTRNAVGIMKRNNFDGHIFNINSIAGHYVPFASTLNVYPAAKNATVAFTQCLVNELSEFKNKIKVTSISPGMVNTNMAAHMLSLRLPMLQPSDIGDAILYVLSTPPSVNITELTIMSVTEQRM